MRVLQLNELEFVSGGLAVDTSSSDVSGCAFGAIGLAAAAEAAGGPVSCSCAPDGSMTCGPLGAPDGDAPAGAPCDADAASCSASSDDSGTASADAGGDASGGDASGDGGAGDGGGGGDGGAG